MPLRVGTLTVRRVQDFEKAASGIVVPRLFFADIRDLTDVTEQLKQGRILRYFPGDDRAVRAEVIPAGFTKRDWVNRCTHDYQDACLELDRSPAGERARKLLFEFLSPAQRLSAMRDRFFEITLYHPQMVTDALESGRPPQFATLRFRIWRGFPNGNIMMGRPQDGRYEYRLCLHPISPYPTDDIILSQLVALQTDANDFIQRANVTRLLPTDPYNMGRSREVMHVGGLFGAKRRPKVTVIQRKRHEIQR